jgi:transposase
VTLVSSPRALNAAQEAEAIRRLRQGEGVRTIADSFDVSHMTIHRLSQRVQGQGNAGAAPSNEPDGVEAIRMEVVERLRAAFQEDHKGSDLAAIANALRSNLDALEKARALRRGSGLEPTAYRDVAANVRARLGRTRAASAPVVEVSEPVTEASPDVAAES